MVRAKGSGRVSRPKSLGRCGDCHRRVHRRPRTEEIYGKRIGWLPSMRPSFAVALQVQRFAHDNPLPKGAI